MADGYRYEDPAVKAKLGKDYLLQTIDFKSDTLKAVNLRTAVEMAFLSQAVRQVLPLTIKNR